MPRLSTTAFLNTIFLSFCFAAFAEEREIVPAKLTVCEYRCGYRNGLYSTIVCFNSTKDIKIPELQPTYLNVEGFSCPLPARAVFQPGPAPLVVVVLGAEGRAMDPMAKRWISTLSESGNHVLAFNSTLNKDFVRICGRGVSGHIAGEAECVRDIIGAALRSPCFEGRVTQLGIVGMSYGGIQALCIGRMVAENKVPYKVDAIQAYSPPIDMMRSAELLDRWWREDRWQYTLPEIYFAVGKHKPVCPGGCIPLSNSLMRAGLAASFRLDLIDIVDSNDNHFDLNLLPRANTFDEQIRRKDFAATWGFSRFMREASYPYWKEKLKLNDFSDLNADAKLCTLLPKVAPIAETIIADDDPLNADEDLQALKKSALKSKLTILDGGGHAGYINDPWARAKLTGLFNSSKP